MSNFSREKLFKIGFIGSAGIPNKYGGFEAFLEHCAPVFAKKASQVIVTCDAKLYKDHAPDFHGVKRVFIGVRANGPWSILHDLFAFLSVYFRTTHIVVLGVSGGIWFPLFRLLCLISGKRLLVNIDGVEWRRTKFSMTRRFLLRLFDMLAQYSAHVIIFDNPALRDFVLKSCHIKAVCIGYSGDHVIRKHELSCSRGTALTVCRIEPENNIDMLIDGALMSGIKHYTIVGNWDQSDYGRKLRAVFKDNKRLSLLDPIYDPEILATLRETCAIYLHGHSVGGTNPSLVEMLFYDCVICCFDVSFNRETAGDCANYFSNANALAALDFDNIPALKSRHALRSSYGRFSIADKYLSAMKV